MPRIRITRFLPLLLVASASTASATITLEFTTLFGGNIASSFANSAGVELNGMRWGIIVDTGATTGVFNVDSYTPFNIATGGFLSTTAGVTNDYFFPASATTFDTTANVESGGSIGDNGTIGTITGVPFGGASGIAQNQKFGLIWFSTNTAAAAGDRYGFFTDASFFMPSDGQSVTRSGPFAGNDPTRPATHTIVAVPEPGAFGFFGVGILGFALRRLRTRPSVAY